MGIISFLRRTVNEMGGAEEIHVNVPGVEETARELVGLKNEIMLKTGKLIKRNFIQHLDYHVAYHCNLNCKCCSTFSPIADKKFVAPEKFQHDLTVLHNVVGDRVMQIHILGGEPLLHPNVEEFAGIARNIFPEARIDFTTNGLLVKSMKPSFWDVLKENNVAIKYTRYPTSFDYDKMVDYIKSKGVFVFSAGGKIEKFRRIPLCLDAVENAWNSYMGCPYTDCATLRDGRLYRCPASAFSDVMNQKLKEAGKGEFQLRSIDYVELQNADAHTVFDFLSCAIPFCSYCKMRNVTEIDWKLSEGSVEEWVDI